MDTNKIVRDLGIKDVAAFTFAVTLARQGKTEQEIIELLWASFNVETKKVAALYRVAYPKIGVLGEDIPYNAIEQMDVVMSIPPAVQGALMPDAHHGYAMPIGGVVALSNAISPSFVGYDIACRVALSVLDIDPDELVDEKRHLLDVMKSSSHFGIGKGYDEPRDHDVMSDHRWQIESALKLKRKAQEQLGTSGGGNHFFDALFGVVISPRDWLVNSHGETIGVDEAFAAIMTHSGSRGTGYQLAKHYQKLAVAQTKNTWKNIPKGYEWLEITSEEGAEYAQVMGLMGDYAKASHEIIHQQFSTNSSIPIVSTFENHHNFAWRDDLSDLIIHRKGATPAGLGQVGIIPGTSATPSFLVEGLGNRESLSSSSHGAGRPFSRSEAKKRHKDKHFDVYRQQQILTSGVAKDETFAAYKDIHRVIELQKGTLVQVVAILYPEIVIMGGKADDGD